MLRVAGICRFRFKDMFNLVAGSLSLYLNVIYIYKHLPWAGSERYIISCHLPTAAAFKLPRASIEPETVAIKMAPSSQNESVPATILCPVTKHPNNAFNILQHIYLSISRCICLCICTNIYIYICIKYTL